MLNLDLLEQLNKQSQWQYGKITRSPKVVHQLQSYFSQRIPEFSMEKAESEQKTAISIQGLLSNKGKYTDLNGFTTRNHSTSTTKGTAQGLIQRYKACYSQRGVTQIHSGRKRLVVRRYGWIQNIANPLLASVLLPDTFCNKNNAISPEAIGGVLSP